MYQNLFRTSIGLVLLALAACNNTPIAPAGTPSSTNVNPETGARGGTNGSH